jgi:dTDP-4-amino-4,6-dideoxygalactose transaminase
MCLTDLESKLTPNTKVIMVVHWGGSPIDLARLSAIQQRCFDRFGFRPAVIEDCAHAIGAEFGGKKLGSHGNLCCFSLQAIKHLTSIDGGVLIAPTARLFDRAKLGRWFGIDRERRSGGGDFRMVRRLLAL